MKLNLKTAAPRMYADSLRKLTEAPPPITSVTRVPTSLPPQVPHMDIPMPNASTKDISTICLDFNPEATQALFLINSGKSCSVVGAAGSGKSTIMAHVIHVLIRSGKLAPLFGQEPEHYERAHCNPIHTKLKPNMPGVCVVALAHKAVNALASKVSPHIEYTYMNQKGELVTSVINARDCLSTVHRLLEFKPMKIEKQQEDGTMLETMRFFPSRHSENPLPDDISLVVMEEAGQIPISLFLSLYQALPHAQYIALGDLGQIGAVGGMSVLGAFLSSLPSVELRHVYRHGGPIMDLATALRNGQTTGLPPKDVHKVESPESKVVRATYPVARMTAAAAMDVAAAFWFKLWTSGNYEAGLDMALCPQDPDSHTDLEKFGLTGIWRRFAVQVDKVLGRNTHYVSTASGPNVIACGDVHYMDSSSLGKRNYMIVRIEHNERYKGAKFTPANYGTREPTLWKALAEAEYELSGGSPFDLILENLEGDNHTMFDALLNDDHTTMFETLKDYEKGRQSTHRVYLLDVDQLETFLLEKGYEGDLRDTYTQYILRRLRNFALSLDYAVIENGVSVNEQEFRLMIEAELASLGIDGFAEGNLHSVSAGADIGSILPPMITIHKGQGSQGRNVFFTTHESVGLNCAESGYTACTRARKALYTVTHGDYWGKHPSIPAELATTSGVHRFTIKGTTKEEKIASYQAAMQSEASSEAAKEERAALVGVLEELKERNNE